MSYAEVPPKASILYAVEVPPAGADTGFLSMYRAYETLPQDVKRRIQGLHCKHDATRNSVGEVRHGFKESYDDPHEMPGAVHPLVRRHPATGRKALYLGRRRNARSEEHTSELQSLMRISYAGFCLKKQTITSATTK